MAGVTDEIAALDFDLTSTCRLEMYDLDRMKANAKLIAYEVGKLFDDRRKNDDLATSEVEVW